MSADASDHNAIFSYALLGKTISVFSPRSDDDRNPASVSIRGVRSGDPKEQPQRAEQNRSSRRKFSPHLLVVIRCTLTFFFTNISFDRYRRRHRRTFRVGNGLMSNAFRSRRGRSIAIDVGFLQSLGRSTIDTIRRRAENIRFQTDRFR